MTLAGNILVTGGTGFIGRHLVNELIEYGHKPVILTRAVTVASRLWSEGSVRVIYGDLSRPEKLDDPCRGIDVVFHLAGYTHADDSESKPGTHLHQRITVDGTSTLLASAIRNHVKTIIFVSSVKAMGESSDVCLDETTVAAPVTSYGRAKLQAENMLLQTAQEHGIHAVILRLPLVYGIGTKGNLDHMIHAIGHRWFPPLPKVSNRRSMVHVDDVVQAVILSATRHAARSNIYLLTDGQVYSTRQIYELLCRAFGRPVPSWSLPLFLLRLLGWIGDVIGKVRGRAFLFNSNAFEKIMGSSCFSSEKISRELGFKPMHTLMESIPEMVISHMKRST